MLSLTLLWLPLLSLSAIALHTPHGIHHSLHSGSSGRDSLSGHGTSSTTAGADSYWLEAIQHQGIAPFNTNSSYQVFRNVKDFGAKGPH